MNGNEGFKHAHLSLMMLVEPVQVEEVGGSFEPKTPIDVDIEVSSNSKKEEEEEEDLVRFEDVMSAASHVVNIL